MLDVLNLAYNLLFDWVIWLIQGLVRVLAALLAIPFVFFMPRGRAYQHLSYSQTVWVRLKFIGKSILTAFSNSTQGSA